MSDETYQTGGIVPPGPPLVGTGSPAPSVHRITAHLPISTELVQDWPGSLVDIMRQMLDGTYQPPPEPPEPTAPPAGHLALLAATDGPLHAVVELHAPRWVHWWCCDGCDAGAHAEDNPDWPCRTVELIAEQIGVDLGGKQA